MKIIKYFGSFLILLVLLNSHAMRTDQFTLYLDKLGKMRSIHENQRTTLLDVRVYRKESFIGDHNALYLTRLKYADVKPYTNKDGTFTGEEALIAEWKDNCPGLLWRQEDCELHHIIPRGYGGQNAWWNIFPLTFKNHRKKGEGIHSSAEYKSLFPRVTGKEE